MKVDKPLWQKSILFQQKEHLKFGSQEI